MSSLLQFSGKVSRQGVRLEFIHVKSIDKPVYNWSHGKKTDEILYTYKSTEDIGPFIPCDVCGKSHPQIYVVWRKPAGMFGCWVVFRYNGKEHVPDLSIPISVEQLPRGYKALSSEENGQAWHN